MLRRAPLFATLMLTTEGAKLLDFGLAQGPALDIGASESTLSMPGGKLTGEGTIVGTLHYMISSSAERHLSVRRTTTLTFLSTDYGSFRRMRRLT